MSNSPVIFDLPFGEYCEIQRLNNTSIKLINRSPFHYKYGKKEETSALVIGHAGHTAILEPEHFESRYAVFPEGMTLTTKEGKATWAELEKSGKSILRFSEAEAARKIAKAVNSHPVAAKLLRGGYPEVTVLGEIDGVETKVRIDYWRPDLKMLIDVKTTENASYDAFQRSIASYGYDIQDAFYIDNCQSVDLDADRFVFIAVESLPPHGVAIYELDDESRFAGRKKYMAGLNRYRECEAFDEWPSYPVDIQPITLPAWAMKAA